VKIFFSAKTPMTVKIKYGKNNTNKVSDE